MACRALEHPLLPGGDGLLLCRIRSVVRATGLVRTTGSLLGRLQAEDDAYFALVADLRSQFSLPLGLVERVFRRAWLSVVRGLRDCGNRADDEGEYSKGGRAEAAQEVLHQHYRLSERAHAVFDLDCFIQPPAEKRIMLRSVIRW